MKFMPPPLFAPTPTPINNDRSLTLHKIDVPQGNAFDLLSSTFLIVDLLMTNSGVLSILEILRWILGVLPCSLVKAAFCGGLISIVKLPLLKREYHHIIFLTALS